MRATEVVLLSLLSFVTLFAIVRVLPRVWRHENRYFDEVPGWWVKGERWWRGYRRGVVLGSAIAPLGLTLGWIAILYPDQMSVDRMPSFLKSFALVDGLLIATLSFVYVSVFL